MTARCIILAISILLGSVAVSAQQQNTTQLSPKTIQQLQAIEKDKAQQTATEKKLSTQLRYTVRVANGKKPVEGAPYLMSSIEAKPETLLQITIKGKITD